jgi:hypothetical protein
MYPLPRLDERFGAGLFKTTYKDDPTFKHSKIIYSIYENDFKEKMA